MTFPTAPANNETAVIDGTTYVYSTSTNSWTIVSEFIDGTTEIFQVVNQTGSTSSTTGALIVTGGVGIGEHLYVGGDIYSNNQKVVTTASINQYANQTSIIAGTDTAISTSTGAITIWNTSTLQTVSDRGNSTTNTILITNATTSTSSLTGALQVVGGAGIQGDLYVGGKIVVGGDTLDNVFRSLIVTGSTSATSTNSGALTVAGGIGLGGDLYVGGSILGPAALRLAQAISSNATGTTSTFLISNTTSAVSTTTGALQVRGGVGIGENLYVGGELYQNGQQVLTTATVNQYASQTAIIAGTDTAVSTSTGNITIWNTSTLQTVSDRGNSTTNTILITNVTIASSTNSGALQVVGGAGVGGDLYVGGSLYQNGQQILTTASVNQYANQTSIIAGTDTALSTSTGAITIWNTSTLQSVTSRGSSTNQAISISNLTVSTSTNTGALTIAGGVGIGGNVNISGITNISNQSTSTSTTTGALQVVGGVGVQGDLYVGGKIVVGGDTLDNSFLNLNVTGTTSATSTTTGALIVTGGVGIGGDIYIGGTLLGPASLRLAQIINSNTTGTTSTFLISNTTSAVSTTTGALQVRGGVGFGGDLYVGGTIYGSTGQTINGNTTGTTTTFLISNTTSAVSTTTGALVVSGGAGIGENLYVGGNVQVIGSITLNGFQVGLGYSGSQGDIGFTGSRGFTGSFGFTGSASTASGYIGSTGFTGSRGEQGTAVNIQGSTSTYTLLPGYPNSYTGANGNGYITSDTGNLWIWTSPSWTNVGKIVGPQGEYGFSGSSGYTGSASTASGYIGSTGFTGSSGAYAALGYTGSKGDVGEKGDTGDIGFTGDIGYTGSIGSLGYTGSLGAIGYTGSRGAFDAIGFTGSASTASGFNGSTGFTGSQGGFDSVQIINTQTGTTYSLALSDAGSLVNFDTANGTTVTILPDSTVNFAVGQRIDIGQVGLGSVVISAFLGVTLHTTDAPILNNQYSIATLIKIGPNEWTFAGPATSVAGYQGSIGFTGSASTATGFTGSKGGFDAVQIINTQTGTSYSLVLSDAGSLVNFDTANGTTVTILPDNTVNFNIGQRIDIGQAGLGSVVVSSFLGVTLHTTDSPILNNQYSIATLIKIGPNEWTFAGPATSAAGYQGSIGYTGSASTATGFTGSKGGFDSIQVISTQTGTSYSLVLSDAGKFIEFTNDSDISVLILQESVVNFAVGQRIDLCKVGAGNVVISAFLGVTLYSTESPSLTTQYSVGTLIKIGQNQWTYLGPAAASTGPIGYTGSTGAPGTSIVGFIGSTGTQGITGYWGSVGYTGSQGYTGSFGFTGSTGTQGITGYWGSFGYTGSIGVAGGVTYSVINTSGGSGSYTIAGSTNPTLTLIKGFTYYFNVNAPTHPFWIKTAAVIGTGSTATGVINNGVDSGIIIFTVPFDAPSTLYYICQIHSGMSGTINVLDSMVGFNGSRGYTGSQGVIGFTGSTGPQGTAVNILGSTSTYTLLPGYPSSYSGANGNGYITTDTGNLWIWTSPSWSNVGTIVGPQGPTGPASTASGYTGSLGYTGSSGYTGSVGISFTAVTNIVGTTSTYTLIPGYTNLDYTGAINDAYTTDTGDLYVWKGSTLGWVFVGNIKGPAGSGGTGGTGSSGTGTTTTFVISNTTTSISTNTGALQVWGGVGIGGDVNIGGTVTGGGIRTTTTSTAPVYPTVGDIWYKSTTDTMFRFTSDGAYSYWLDITGPTISSTAIVLGDFVARTYNGNGSQTTFSVTTGCNVASVIVTENGLVQAPITDYTISSGILSFATAPASGIIIGIREFPRY